MGTTLETAPGTATVTPVQALNRLVDIIMAYCSTQAFVAACKLGLFEQLSDGPSSAEGLAQRTNIHPVGCRRLLVALAKLGLVDRDGELFRNSAVSRYCSSKASVDLSALSGFAEPFYHMFAYLPDALQEYSPRWQQALGTSKEDVFGALYEDRVRLMRFAQLMNATSIPQGQLIAERFDFRPYQCIMDVVGGPGGQAVQIGLKHIHLRGIVTDLPPVCEIARGTSTPRDLPDVSPLFPPICFTDRIRRAQT